MSRVPTAILSTIAAITLFALLAPLALAQPMIDPSRMSGIPRPDPSVPPGRLVVRVIRGDFAHPMVGEEVTLDGPDAPRTVKVDQTAHATFDGLKTSGEGAYTVRATAFGETLTSQPIEMSPASGVKVMLVFKPDAQALLGEHDGVARADQTLPAGRVEISVVDGNDKPLAGIDVVIAHSTKDGSEQKAPEEKIEKTDAEGHVRFEGKPSTSDGYLVAVKKEGLTASSKPFSIESGAGMRLGLRALPLTHRLDVLSIGRRSHVILELKDDEVDVIENLVITNTATDPFEAKPLSFPLPAEAEGIQLAGAGEGAAGFAVEGKAVVYRGVLPPGDTPLSFGFVLQRNNDGVELRQTLPIEMEQMVAVTDRFEGMNVSGDGLEKVEREMNGRPFWVISGPPIKAGGTLALRLDGLPHRSTIARNLAVAAMIMLAIWGLVASLAARPLAEARRVLEAQRKSLLDELCAIDAKLAAVSGGQAAKVEAKQARRRDELIEKLEQVYRQLDEGAPNGRS